MEPIQLSVEQAMELDFWRRVELAKRYAREKNILAWGAVCFPDKFGLRYCYQLHDYLIAIRGHEFTSTKAPRYHSKTTVGKFLIPTFQAVEEPASFVHYLQVQATDSKANSVNRSIRSEFEENRILQHIYGDLVGARWTDEQFVLSNGVCFSAVGAGQSIRGINYRNRRPDYIMPDDLYDEKDIHNPESTEKKNQWFWSTLYPARAQGRRTSIQVTGTAVSQLDLMNRLEKLKHVKSRTFKAIPDWEKKIVLWPEKNTFESLMQDMESMTSSIFMREMQNEPQDDADSLVKASWLKRYEARSLVPVPGFEYVGCYLGGDPSIGQKEENDFTALVMYYVFRYTDGRGYHYHLAKMWNEHWTLDQRVRKLQEIQDHQSANRKITLAFLEGVAGFKDFVAEARRRTTLPIREVEQIKDKLAILEAKAWFFETGRVSISDDIDAKIYEEWKYQMTTNHPKHDDLRDATLLPLELVKVDALSYMD